MAATTAAAAGLNMKLLVDTKAQRMLFAEASKDVVDFLFSLLALPVGTAVKLLGEESMELPSPPTVASPAAITGCSLFGLPAPRPAPAPPRPNKFFRSGGSYESDDEYADYCSRRCRNYMTDASDTACPCYRHRMDQEVQFLPSAGSRQPAEQEESPRGGGGDDGFVQAVVTYTVMDDLTVKPMSAVTSITLLTTFAVADLAALQERTVRIGHAEALGILKASLQSKTVLTDVFLNKKAAPGDA
ncbi:hypothetical protein PVAP13_5KG110600 [Panicum virgatum]|uniref:Uncharacterized protein n=1 Tax=Panicum virgatum TaxID=38727 RepID=A0A8T0SFB3_PANVG|nr:hypothetical protein PVAP13_5KG110600 [Panicum virgatum]